MITPDLGVFLFEDYTKDMRLSHEQEVVRGLERGLGEAHWLFDATQPDLRLRMEGACGITTIAISERLNKEGASARMVLSSPNLAIDPGMHHVMTLVDVEGNDYIVDANYSSFLAYAGLFPGYVTFGGANRFPERKIAVFRPDDRGMIVEELAGIAQDFLLSREYIEKLQLHRPEFQTATPEQIVDTYDAIWNPDNFSEYQPTAVTLEAGRKLAAFITPGQVKLVA